MLQDEQVGTHERVDADEQNRISGGLEHPFRGWTYVRRLPNAAD